MVGNLCEHVVEKTESCGNITASGAVKVDTHIDIRFTRRALHLTGALTRHKDLRNLLPVHPVRTNLERPTA